MRKVRDMSDTSVISNGMSWSVSIPGMLDQAIEGVAGANPAEPMYLDNTGHPASNRLALAKATRSHAHAFGLDWDDDSGRNELRAEYPRRASPCRHLRRPHSQGSEAGRLTSRAGHHLRVRHPQEDG
jgi:hypothetical protein